jgi:hypothetical protein
MKRLLILIGGLSLVLLVLSGCGHLDGNDPEGVIGGHEGGYGSFGTGIGNEYFPDLLSGSWSHSDNQGNYDIITFHADGTMGVESFNPVGTLQHARNGSYFISTDRIDLNVPGWNTGSATFSVIGNNLTLVKDNNSTIYHKIS